MAQAGFRMTDLRFSLSVTLNAERLRAERGKFSETMIFNSV